VSSHYESSLETRDRRRRAQGGRLMIAGLVVFVAGVLMLLGGHALITAMHLTTRDDAYIWFVLPELAVAAYGGLLFFFGMVDHTV
jgi:hypothetical protein